MTTKTIKFLVFLALLVHGIGHIQGVVAASGVKFTRKTSHQSWLLKGLAPNGSRTLCMILYGGAAVTGIVAALAFRGVGFSGLDWQSWALASALFSTGCLVLFPHALAMFFNKLGAIGVNLLIYYSILFQQQWPAAIFDQ